MVNKVAVLLVGGIVLVGVVVIGGVAALVLGGGGNGNAGTPTAVAATPLPSPGAGTATATVAGTASVTATGTVTATGPATVTPTPTVTSTATPRPTVPPSEFDAEAIERHIERLVNERRQAEGLDPLRLNGTTPTEVTQMARDHSVAMADEGQAVHVIDGNTSTDRYHAYDLYHTCQWQRPGGESFAKSDASGITVSENGFETVARTIAGREYEVDGETRFNGDEAAVAQAIVEEWWNTSVPPHRERLLLPNARMLGVGVEVTQFGEVYATANLC